MQPKVKSITPAIFLLTLLVLLYSCVPQKKFVNLQSRFDALTADKAECESNNKSLTQKNESLTKEIEGLKNDYSKLDGEYKELEAQLDQQKKAYGILNDNFDKYKANETSTKDEMKKSLRELEDKLLKKELELNEKEANLLKKEKDFAKLNSDKIAIENDLKAREKKVKELENLLKQKDSSVNKLKETLTKALLGYKESGMTVTSRDGKVYVSVDEKLLFASGRTDVSPLGKKALLKLSETLKSNSDFDIVIEGHTDDVPIKSARFDDNWDLSVLRATSVTRILTSEGGIDPKKIIPSGRSEYFPVNSAKTDEARAKNRRIEIILTPNLKDIMKILNK